MPLVIPTKRLHEASYAVFYVQFDFKNIRLGLAEKSFAIWIGKVQLVGTKYDLTQVTRWSCREIHTSPYQYDHKNRRASIGWDEDDIGVIGPENYLGIVPGKLDLEDRWAVHAYVTKVARYLDFSTFG